MLLRFVFVRFSRPNPIWVELETSQRRAMCRYRIQPVHSRLQTAHLILRFLLLQFLFCFTETSITHFLSFSLTGRKSVGDYLGIATGHKYPSRFLIQNGKRRMSFGERTAGNILYSPHPPVYFACVCLHRVTYVNLLNELLLSKQTG